jgi:hypothetical protein
MSEREREAAACDEHSAARDGKESERFEEVSNEGSRFSNDEPHGNPPASVDAAG